MGTLGNDPNYQTPCCILLTSCQLFRWYERAPQPSDRTATRQQPRCGMSCRRVDSCGHHKPGLFEAPPPLVLQRRQGLSWSYTFCYSLYAASKLAEGNRMLLLMI